MEAPFRSEQNPFIGKPVREEEKDAVEMQSHPAERVTHVANLSLREAMKKTMQQLAKKKPLLALMKPHKGLEENFFRLMDTIHLLAKIDGKDRPDQGITEKECKNLIELANRLPLSTKSSKDEDKLYMLLWSMVRKENLDNIDKMVVTAIGLSEQLPQELRDDILRSAYVRSESDDLKLEILKLLPLENTFSDSTKDLFRRIKDHKKVLAYIKTHPQSSERAIGCMYIAAGHIDRGDISKAYPYIKGALAFPYQISTLVNALFQKNKLPTISLEAIFHIANMLKSEDKDSFLYCLIPELGRRKQYDDFLAVFEALQPGKDRNQSLQEAIRHLPEDAPEWLKPALIALISDPAQQKALAKTLKQS